MSKPDLNRGSWSGRWAFILVSIGSAVGLGNLWKFPYIVGQYGGGGFILVYLLCIAIIGVPIFMAEVHIGRTCRSNVVQAFEIIKSKTSLWRHLGWLCGLTALIMISIFSLVGGWVFYYLFGSILGQVSQGGVSESGAYMGQLLARPAYMIMWQVLFVAAIALVVGRGVQKGIERCNKILMPALGLILGVLLIQSFFLDGFGEALRFLFVFDFGKLSGEAVIEAMGHAMFTLSVGLGSMIVYGSYMSDDESIVTTSFTIAALDTIIALIAAVVILSVVFSFGLEPQAGPTLIFETLPTLFAQMPGGRLLASAFFLLVGFAAITSALSIMELLVSYLIEKFNAVRLYAALFMGVIVSAIGSIGALSFNVLSDVKIWDKSIFDFLNFFAASILLPICGLMIILFYSWAMGRTAISETLGTYQNNRILSFSLLWISRLITPLAIVVIFLNLIF